MTNLIEYLNSIHPLSGLLREHLKGIIQRKELIKKEYLLNEGQVCRNIYFIEKGLLRCYYVKNGLEISSWFGKKNDLSMAVESFLKQQPSNENIQAMEETVLDYIPYDDLQQVFQDFPEFNINLRIFIEGQYILSEQRLAAIRMQRAHEKYTWLMERFPDLFQLVPAKYIASYIGMTEVTLSIVKGKK